MSGRQRRLHGRRRLHFLEGFDQLVLEVFRDKDILRGHTDLVGEGEATVSTHGRGESEAALLPDRRWRSAPTVSGEPQS